MQTIGEKIKLARKAKKMTQDDLADILGVNRVAISNYEQGKNNPPYAKLGVLSDILGIQLLDTGTDITMSIPFAGLASDGIPKEIDLTSCKRVPIDNKLYKDGMYAVEAEGYSMSPKINNGNIVYCSPGDETISGSIVHYTYKNESGIRKLRIDEEQSIITLLPINSDYNVIVIDEFGSSDLRMSKVVGVVDTDF